MLKKHIEHYTDHPNSIFYECKACGSKPGEPCSQPTENGRKNVKWFHYARSGLVVDLEQQSR